MRKLIPICAIAMALTGSVFAHDDKGDKVDVKNLIGKWLPTSAEIAGKKAPEDFTKTTVLTLTEGNYSAKVGEQVDKGTYAIDSSKTPKTMSITSTDGPNKGKTFLAIYELTGDTLKVCYDMSGKAHPKEFKTKPDTALSLITYKREKS